MIFWLCTQNLQRNVTNQTIGIIDYNGILGKRKRICMLTNPDEFLLNSELKCHNGNKHPIFKIKKERVV